jgi:DNA mismatch repair protein MutL
MGQIRILEEHIANQIAAGEVIERPSSVVKELVENAVDAHALRIDVEIEEAGLAMIRVTDNGSGMAADDCEAAFGRHATSKIVSGSDLFRIRTLGFRGEALPSIAAVAKVECATSCTEDGLGRKLVIEGGTIRFVGETAMQRGTTIAVKDLFYNTPARLKYMKTVQTELSHVSDFMYRLALSRPDIAFSLKHNGTRLLHTSGNGDLLQVFAAIYGTGLAKTMVAIEADDVDYRLTGLISRPESTRSNRMGVTTVVNGRYIRNYAIVPALMRGYHTLLPIHRYPLAVLCLTMDPTLVDVNVHPSKLEVRFSKEPELLAFLDSSVKRTLQQHVLIPQFTAKKDPPAKVWEQMTLYGSGSTAASATGAASDAGAAPDNLPVRDSRSALTSPLSSASTDFPASPASSDEPPLPEPPTDRFETGEPPLPQPPAAMSTFNASPGSKSLGFVADRQPAQQRTSGFASRPDQPARTDAEIQAAKASWQAIADAPSVPAAIPSFPVLSAVGQIHGTYIAAQNEDGLYLIDQHAAHERINYEIYYDKFGEPSGESQQLLVPVTMEFTSDEAGWLKDHLALFTQIGIDIEHFGGSTFLVRAYPHWFPPGDEADLLQEIAEWVLAERKAIDIAKLREKSAILCSCKASIKANQNLSISEMNLLLIRLGQCRNPYTCPHGRPIAVSFSVHELEKMFKRVM